MNLFLLTNNIKQKFPLREEPLGNEPLVDEPVEPGRRRSGVMAILYPYGSETHALLIKRSENLRQHPGQIAFPGGLYDEEDGDFLTTALRETKEEIGLTVPRSKVIGRLSQVFTLTGIEINPFVAVLGEEPECEPNASEVEEVLRAPLAPLLATKRRDEDYPLDKKMFTFWFGKHKIWGATARLLNEMAQLSAH